MKKQQITFAIILILLCADVVLLVMNRKAHAEMDGQSSVTVTEQKPSINDVTKSVRNMLNDLPEEEESDSPQAERRQLRRKVREERAYTLMALDALRMRILKEAKQKALHGREVCRPYMDMINGRNMMLQDMVREEGKKIARKNAKLFTPRMKAMAAEHQERIRKKRDQINAFIHDLDTGRFDSATANAHADYLAALDEFRALYNDPSASYEAKLAAQNKADTMAGKFSFLFKSNYLDQGFNQEKQKNERYVSALHELLCQIRFQAEINKSEPSDDSNQQDNGQKRESENLP